MVVNVYNKEHLEKYISSTFYHIPKKKLAHVKLGVKYLAFYMSKENFGDEGGVQYYAVIKDVIEYKRSECQELKCREGKEEDIYLRFNLESINKIKNVQPIQSARLISYTTLYLLKNARNMHMLNVKSNFEVKVYKELINIAQKAGVTIIKKDEKYYLNNHQIEVLESNEIRVDNKFIEFDSLEKFM